MGDRKWATTGEAPIPQGSPGPEPGGVCAVEKAGTGNVSARAETRLAAALSASAARRGKHDSHRCLEALLRGSALRSKAKTS